MELEFDVLGVAGKLVNTQFIIPKNELKGKKNIFLSIGCPNNKQLFIFITYLLALDDFLKNLNSFFLIFHSFLMNFQFIFLK
jgi:hypothetical protein